MKLIIFTEAGFNYGFGHFYRMSGICERALRIGQKAEMHLIADREAKKNLNREYVVFDNWKDPNVYKRILGQDVTVVVDSYHVDIGDLENFKNHSRNMIVIDDNMRLDYHDMVILNPNYFGPSLNYPEGRGNTVFAGKDCTLLRDEFSLTEDRRVKREVSDILITMGGTDVKEMTAGTINAIRSISEDVRLHVICTKAYKNLEKIRDLLSPNDSLYMNIGASEMCELMKKCDFAVATAGGTTNELIRMQCPSVFSVVVVME